jgi:ketosteroid isomerase-like protein
MTDRERLTKIITDMTTVSDGVQLGRKYMDDSCYFIRPTGNPLNVNQWDEMMNSEHVSITYGKLISINRLEISGDMAFACYTSHGKFTYNGIHNDDVTVLTSVFRKIEGSWKIIHGHRSTGRSPGDELPKFE